MRVYELARELGVDSKELLAHAGELTIDVKTASSALDDEAAELLRLAFAPGEAVEEAPAEAPVVAGRLEFDDETSDLVIRSPVMGRVDHEETTSTDRLRQASRMGRVYFGKSEAVVAAEDELESQAQRDSVEDRDPAKATLEVTPTAGGPMTELLEGRERPAPEEISVDLKLEQQSHFAFVESVQLDVLESIQNAMRWWFGFYFDAGEGSGRERLEASITGLRNESHRLRELSDGISSGDDLGRIEVDAYGRAVGIWANAMDTLAQGIELDQQSVVREGLSLLVEASDTAKLVVRRSIYPNLVLKRGGAERASLVGDSLADLSALSPSQRVPSAVVGRAKQPWYQSIVAAGSPIRHVRKTSAE